MTLQDALKRLAQCRANQPGMQVIVAAEIVDALLNDVRAPSPEAQRPH